jgi:hypothetical protein
MRRQVLQCHQYFKFVAHPPFPLAAAHHWIIMSLSVSDPIHTGSDSSSSASPHHNSNQNNGPLGPVRAPIPPRTRRLDWNALNPTIHSVEREYLESVATRAATHISLPLFSERFHLLLNGTSDEWSEIYDDALCRLCFLLVSGRISPSLLLNRADVLSAIDDEINSQRLIRGDNTWYPEEGTHFLLFRYLFLIRSTLTSLGLDYGPIPAVLQHQSGGPYFLRFVL